MATLDTDHCYPRNLLTLLVVELLMYSYSVQHTWSSYPFLLTLLHVEVVPLLVEELSSKIVGRSSKT